MKSFRELRVWQAGMELVEEVYRLTRQFPQEEKYALASQIQRAAVSIPSNIAEGHTREHLKECLHHVSMAQASLAELETQLEITARLGYIGSDQLHYILQKCSSLGKQLYALRNSLARAPGRAIPVT
jgi:four helix bundle protein